MTIDAISSIGLPAPMARTGGPSGVAEAGGAATGTGFADMLASAAGHANLSLNQAEQISLQALAGGGQTRDVVDAVLQAEQSLQAAIAIRDKIVTAFLEISRMSI